MLDGRTTCLRFDDHETDIFPVNNGIGQGDPLSMILYLFYNADLIEIPRNIKEDSKAFVDDSILVAFAKDFHEAHQILADMMTRPGGAIEWSKTHNSNFELDNQFHIPLLSYFRTQLIIVIL